jgi:hypothetical protein
MSLVDTAKQALVDAAVTPIVRERLSLALDEATLLEKKVADLQTQIGELRAEIKISRANEKETKTELEALRKEHEEEVRLVRGVEIRKGKRTGGAWMAFCPKCHLPLQDTNHDTDGIFCPDIYKCHWMTHMTWMAIRPMIATAN